MHTVHSCTWLWLKDFIWILQQVWEYSISLKMLPGFSSLLLCHTVILPSLHCFFSVSLLSNPYASAFPLSLFRPRLTVPLSVFLFLGRIQGHTCMRYSKSLLLTAGCRDSSVNHTQQCRHTESCRDKGLEDDPISNPTLSPCTRSNIRINTEEVYTSISLISCLLPYM